MTTRRQFFGLVGAVASGFFVSLGWKKPAVAAVDEAGCSIRFIRMYDPIGGAFVHRMDVLYGFQRESFKTPFGDAVYHTKIGDTISVRKPTRYVVPA
jgi:hypothetical protein